MSWHKALAEQLSRHSDALAVVRAGRDAKRRTIRRDRQRARSAVSRIDVDAILESLGPEFSDPGEDPWGGANLEPCSGHDG